MVRREVQRTPEVQYLKKASVGRKGRGCSQGPGALEHWTLPAASEGTGGGTVSPDITAVGAANLWPEDLEDNAGRAAAFDVSSNRRCKSQGREGPLATSGRG